MDVEIERALLADANMSSRVREGLQIMGIIGPRPLRNAHGRVAGRIASEIPPDATSRTPNKRNERGRDERRNAPIADYGFQAMHRAPQLSGSR
jgi:hypothetical protein